MEIGFPPKIGGLTVVSSKNLADPSKIDYCEETVLLDTARPEWQWSIVLFKRTFVLINKKGTAEQPIAEIDLKRSEILINWGHPVQRQMDERGFLRTALAWVLAKEAADKDPGRMMDLALRLMAFSTNKDG